MARCIVAYFFLLLGTSNLTTILIILLGLLRIYLSPSMLAMYGYYGIMHGATYGYHENIYGATYG